MPTLLNITESPVDGLSLTSFSGQEELSRLFSFTLNLASEDDHNVAADKIVGKPFGFSIQTDLTEASGAIKQDERFFHGHVSRFVIHGSEGGLCRYEIEVVPQLWFLTRSSDCRIFSKQKVPDILETILKEYDVQFEAKWSKGDYPDREYCVQYRETDFNFVSRLMEQEGIFYYFQHKENEHKMVLCDASSHYDANSNCQDVHYDDTYPYVHACVTRWVREFQLVRGGYAQTDYNFDEKPARSEKTPAALLKTTAAATDPAKKVTDPKKYEIFDYPGEYVDTAGGEHYTKRRMEEETAAFDVANGASTQSHFSAGVKMKLAFPDTPDKHPQKDAQEGEYAIRSVSHAAGSAAGGKGSGAEYSNTFSAIPADTAFRAARITPKPLVNGAQTAVVVGPPGSEINTDELGRIQLQFFWDRYGTRLQPGADPDVKPQEPLWVRVGQISAGKQWGAMFIPRVGQEVIVTFLEGDPDRPLVTGGVYNSDQEPAYDPKEHKTRSGIKTCSSPGAEGFNELRFEDKKGDEQVYIHAEKDMDVRVKNDAKLRVYGDRHQIIGSDEDEGEGGNFYESIYQDKHLEVKKDLIRHIEGNSQLMIGLGDADDGGNLDVVVEKQESRKIGADLNISVGGNTSEDVGNNFSRKIGGDYQQKVGGSHAVDAGQAIHIKSGMTVVVEAAAQLTLKVGGNFIDISAAGIAIKGSIVLINSGGAPGSGTGASPKSPAAAKEAESKEPKVAAKENKHKSGQLSTPF